MKVSLFDRSTSTHGYRYWRYMVCTLLERSYLIILTDILFSHQ